MFARNITGWVCAKGQRAQVRFADYRPLIPRLRSSTVRQADHQLPPQRERASAFTLLELLLVVGIIAILLVLITPAFTSMKTGADLTNAVYGIQGVLEHARTYAKANHTYVFVGFAEVDSSVDPSVSPQITTGDTPYGRVAMAVVAAKDGTSQYQYATTDQGNDWNANYANGAHLITGH